MTLKIVKQGPTVERERAWYHSWPKDADWSLRPHEVFVSEGELGPMLHISLERGHHPSSWSEPGLWWAVTKLWTIGEGPLPISPGDYVAYVTTRVHEYGLHNVVSPMRVDRIRNLLLDTSQYSSVRRCHGDLTLENVIRRADGSWCFVDPGDPRGLPCREIDEAKMLQSAEGWDLRRGTVSPTEARGRLPFKVTRLHYALLVTHYVRILCHDHPEDLLAWTREKLLKTAEAIGI